MQIRPERPDDVDAIYALTMAAFAPMAFSDNTEACAVPKMRAAGTLTLSLVAEQNGKVIGHVAFSPAVIETAQGAWFGLGPIAVQPGLQRRGTGRGLIRHGLELLVVQGAAGCVLIGDPHVYGSSGFVSNARLSYRDVAAKYVQFRSFDGTEPAGEITFAKGLDD